MGALIKQWCIEHIQYILLFMAFIPMPLPLFKIKIDSCACPWAV